MDDGDLLQPSIIGYLPLFQKGKFVGRHIHEQASRSRRIRKTACRTAKRFSLPNGYPHLSLTRSEQRKRVFQERFSLPVKTRNGTKRGEQPELYPLSRCHGGETANLSQSSGGGLTIPVRIRKHVVVYGDSTDLKEDRNVVFVLTWLSGSHMFRSWRKSFREGWQPVQMWRFLCDVGMV